LCRPDEDERSAVSKKILLLALAVVGGLLAYRQVQASRAEQDLWTEATDPIKPASDLR
jgi:MYXO-CTERM domain-containing protein